MAEKKTPQRMCVCCRTMRDKKELVRVVRTPEGRIVIDPTGKANGRGAYLCREKTCLERVLKSRPLAKIFGVPAEDAVYEALREVLLG